MSSVTSQTINSTRSNAASIRRPIGGLRLGMLICIGAVLIAEADTHYVSLAGLDQPPYTNLENAAVSIQSALDASSNNDSVLVSSGTYYVTSAVSLLKDVEVRGIAGREATIVDGQNSTTCFILYSPNAVLSGLTLRHGKASSAGGVICSKGTVTNCLIIDNVADRGGGALCDGTGVLVDCVIQRNSQNSIGKGGGVFCGVSGVVRHCTISGNTAGSGGGIYFDGGGVVSECTISGNSESVNGSGGGVHFALGGLLLNCTIFQNTSTRGGGIYFLGGGVAQNCTIVNNTARLGGGTYDGSDNQYRGAVTNCIIYFNNGWESGVNYYDANPGFRRISYCCTAPHPGGTGNTASDPTFVNYAGGDYRLKYGSPCVNTGFYSDWMETATDLDGRPRIMRGAVDMGAYELRASQSPLAFSPASPQMYQTTNALSITGGTGTGAVSYGVESGLGQIVDGSNLWVTASTGIVVVSVDKADDFLNLAASATAQVVCTKAEQAITFTPISNQVTTNTLLIGSTASSGLPVDLVVASGPAMLADGTNLSFTGGGLVMIVASQAGNDYWNPATGVTNSFTVTKVAASVTLSGLAQTYDGTPRLVTGTTVPSGLVVQVTYEGNEDAPTNGGVYAVTGTVSDAMYQGVTNDILMVARVPQTIAFPVIVSQEYTASVGLMATASSELPVAFSIVPGVGMLNGATNLTFTGPGDVLLVASQAGNDNYYAAPDVPRIIKVYRVSPISGPSVGGNTITITNGVLGNGSDITNVLVGGMTAAITNQGTNWVTITVPSAGSTGVKDITIESASIGGTTFAGAYTVNPAGQIYQIAPASGRCNGSYPVVIIGTNLGNGADITDVTLCGIPATIIGGQSATQVTIAAPASLPVCGDVVIHSTSYGTTIASNAFTYFAVTATGTAVIVNGFVVGVNVVDGGAGYTNEPLVRIIGDGTNALAVAIVSNGVVTGINVVDAGSGYTGTPIVVIRPPFIQQPLANSITLMELLTFSNLVAGTNYQLQALQSAVWTNIGNAFAATSSIYSIYSSHGPSNTRRLAVAPAPRQAFATAEVTNGFVIGVTVIDGGWGYVTNPVVHFIGTGINAGAKSSVTEGVVSAISVLTAGSGYTSNVVVQIDPPPAVAMFPNVTPILAVSFGRLSPYDTYELERVQNLGDIWRAYGAPVVPTTTLNTVYITETNSQGFYRAHYLH